ncbi:MAG: hypothetical protein HFJ45_07335 [Clostridia bacterium]|nr:hypothetical protein [Clostridia bacterium]
MKSICLKTNNDEIISCMIRKLEDEFEDIIISSNQFKIYKNVIVHYIGENEKSFRLKIAELISYIIENFYEEQILDKIIDENYCYFETFERDVILKISEKIIELQETSFKYKNEILKGLVYEYFLDDNKIMILDGFVNFRLKPYLEVLDYVVDTSVTNFVLGLQ